MENYIQQIIDQYIMARQQPIMLSVVIAVVMGMLICFFGYKLLRVWCAIIGFAAGAAIAGLIAYAMNADVMLVALIAGVITAVLSFLFYESGVFVIGFGATLNVLGHLINIYEINTKWWIIILAIAAAIIVGSLAVKLVRPVVIISTSVVTNILGIFDLTNWIVILSATGIIAALGIVYQFTHTGKKHSAKAVPEQKDEWQKEYTEYDDDEVSDSDDKALDTEDVPALPADTEAEGENAEQAMTAEESPKEETEESME